MKQSLFTFKELKDVYLSCYAEIKIGSRIYAPGEVFTSFEKIQIGNLKELTNWKSANGGFDNRAQVLWEDSKGIAIEFSQGVVSKEQFAISTGSKYEEIVNQIATMPVKRYYVVGIDSQYLDMLSDDDNWVIKFLDPIDNIKQNIVVKDCYGNNIAYEMVEENPYMKLLITPTETTDYFPLTVTYENIIPRKTKYTFGKPQTQAWFSLQGVIDFVDDKTGEKTQQLLTIPKLKITSELNATVGVKANPVVETFTALAVPVGDRVHKEIMTLDELPTSVAFI